MGERIIIGTNIVLSRNITDYPFPHKLSKSEADTITNKINNVILKSDDLYKEDFVSYNIRDISNIEKNTLIERNIISNKFAKSDIGSIIVNKDKKKCIVINDENHIEIKIQEDDLNIDESFNIANKIDNILSEKIEYAFNDKWGYLNCRPTNSGTGLKASFIVHLPVSSLQRKINIYANIAHKLGADIIGVSNEKSNTLGNLFEISNKSIIGRSEKNIIESLKSLANDIVKKENDSRMLAKMETSIELEDKIYRSLGILQNARIISASEAMRNLSNIKLGIEMNYIEDINLDKVTNLMKGLKPLMRIMTEDTIDSDIKRAEFLRNEFTLANKNKK